MGLFVKKDDGLESSLLCSSSTLWTFYVAIIRMETPYTEAVYLTILQEAIERGGLVPSHPACAACQEYLVGQC